MWSVSSARRPTATCRASSRVRRRLPEVAVTWRELDSADQLVELDFGRLDLGLVRPIAAVQKASSRVA
ncbi:hypothetical protein [Chenggangzhangella methanolivorans]|uniref:hypothetical protein n=1 Tax=Chenggangzhangella methanolivorans TaxID=1437009 RepID=UPI0021BD97F7|nr:hypothetical protein [Chenggangzhangella methanolivorans]